jgi:Prokaryotic cytochrome b561
MKSSQPYQPLLLRILHGLTGLFLVAAVLTAVWTYDTYDGRWGRIPLPHYKEIEGLHGTFGLFTLLIFPALVIYACHQGQRRLIQPDSLAKLAQVGKPIWWYTLSRITNTLSILAVTFALFSGKMMNETWLPKGELEHGWYYAHLLGWILVVLCIALHVLMNARVGGSALLMSILNWRFRDSPGERLRQRDHPALWYSQISEWLSDLRLHRRANWLRFSFPSALAIAYRQVKADATRTPTNSMLIALEVFVLTSLVAAWIIPLFE